MTDTFNKNKDASLKSIMRMMIKEFGTDINYRIKLSDGRVFKTQNWDRLEKGLYDKLQNEQK